MTDDQKKREPLLEMFLFESSQLIEQLEEYIIDIEQEQQITQETIQEIFRIMHTLKGSAAMMGCDGLAKLAHALEDLFDVIRDKPDCLLQISGLTDCLLQAVDYCKSELALLSEEKAPRHEPHHLIKQIHQMQENLKSKPDDWQEQNHYYFAKMYFTPGCEMENMRAYGVIHTLQDIATTLYCEPGDLLDDENSTEIIRRNGFSVCLSSPIQYDELYALIDQTLFLDRLLLEEIDANTFAEKTHSDQIDELRKEKSSTDTASTNQTAAEPVEQERPMRQQSMISVHISKLDYLMDLVGELVISEAMVTNNPELHDLPLEQFHKAARQLRKLTHELQDTVMSIRMIPMAATFHQMQRLVRDMSHRLNRQIVFQLIGEQTEVDKSIVDQLADPLMHLIRNAVDHGIESPEERLKAGKPEQGTIVLEARTAGNDVWISVRDDGRGLDREKILNKAKSKGLLTRPEEEYSDREIYSFILLPGFSTRDNVTEYSGRGVGMDVVRESILRIGGAMQIESKKGYGTHMMIRIPLTLAIIDGMLIQVGQEIYIVPIISIRESFRPDAEQIIIDSENNELILVRGVCTNVVRLHERFDIKNAIDDLTEGIIIVVEDDERMICLFADRLIGEQQVVVKPLPKLFSRIHGLAGCTILGDGRISLILDIAGFFS